MSAVLWAYPFYCPFCYDWLAWDSSGWIALYNDFSHPFKPVAKVGGVIHPTTRRTQFMSTETKSVPSTIKFTYAENGELNVHDGDTVFSTLLTIGALTKTAKRKYTGDALYKEYSTDAEGLERLQSMSSEALVHISSTIATLGKMLVYVERDELGDAHLGNFAWLVTGLGEILEQLSYENDEISHTLTQLSKQNAINASAKTERAGKRETIQ